jgi:hypothetical protein
MYANETHRKDTQKRETPDLQINIFFFQKKVVATRCVRHRRTQEITKQ